MTATAPLRRRLAEVRRAGVVVFDRRDPAPVASEAAPVRNGSGTTVAAVSVVVPAGTSSPRAYEHGRHLLAAGLRTRGVRRRPGDLPRPRADFARRAARRPPSATP